MASWEEKIDLKWLWKWFKEHFLCTNFEHIQSGEGDKSWQFFVMSCFVVGKEPKLLFVALQSIGMIEEFEYDFFVVNFIISVKCTNVTLSSMENWVLDWTNFTTCDEDHCHSIGIFNQIWNYFLNHRNQMFLIKYSLLSEAHRQLHIGWVSHTK